MGRGTRPRGAPAAQALGQGACHPGAATRSRAPLLGARGATGRCPAGHRTQGGASRSWAAPPLRKRPLRPLATMPGLLVRAVAAARQAPVPPPLALAASPLPGPSPPVRSGRCSWPRCMTATCWASGLPSGGAGHGGGSAAPRQAATQASAACVACNTVVFCSPSRPLPPPPAHRPPAFSSKVVSVALPLSAVLATLHLLRQAGWWSCCHVCCAACGQAAAAPRHGACRTLASYAPPASCRLRRLPRPAGAKAWAAGKLPATSGRLAAWLLSSGKLFGASSGASQANMRR